MAVHSKVYWIAISVNTDHTKHVVVTNNPELDQLSSGLYL